MKRRVQRKAFTMIELVFVIVVLGILAAIAVPRLAATRDDAEVAKIRSDVSSIRSAIVSERQIRLLKGQSNYVTRLDKNVASNTADVALFDGNGTGTDNVVLLQYPIYTTKESSDKPTSGHWIKKGVNQYVVNVAGTLVDFNYTASSGTFSCGTSPECISLLR